MASWRLDIGVQATGVKNARWVEGTLQVAMDLHQGRRERLEHPGCPVAAAEQRRMAAGARRGFPDRLPFRIRSQPTQGAAPFDQMSTRQVQRRRGGLDRSEERRVGKECRSRVMREHDRSNRLWVN